MRTQAYEQIVEGILQNGYAISDNFLNQLQVAELKESLLTKYDSGSFKEAKIGKLSEVQLDTSVRGDEILWLEENSEVPSEIFLLKLNSDFIQYLNSTCFLGLTHSELHYAKYPTGKSYKRHLDSFQAQKGRLLSVIYYLNENWVTSDGGNLIIYSNTNGIEEKISIEPIAGRFVCFQSDKLEHEVLETFKDRFSITGWLVRQ